MRELINFFLKYNVLFVFILCETLCFYLLSTYNSYHRASAVASSNAITGSLFNMSNDVSGYVGLKRENEDLHNENARLRQILFNQNFDVTKRDTLVDLIQVTADSTHVRGYVFTAAKVINNSTNGLFNNITINKGSKHGFKPDMGLVSANGVVGIIKNVSASYSSAMSLLNKNLKLTAKIRHKQYTGSFSWDGMDARFAQLLEVPNHAKIQKNDTISTSGYSSIFPEDFMIGTIEDFDLKEGSNFYDIKIKLATDFYKLRRVDGVENLNRKEQIELEYSTANE